ncbi:MAG TPA: pyridoxal-dependent decarboxylase [Pyrinomonadaceae bacterium]|jgi:glutamate/tyrosine decarboxylase-like PLP-dependent enzyme
MTRTRASEQQAAHASSADDDITTTASARGSSLDVPDESLRALAERAGALVTDYFARVAALPVFPSTTAAEIAAQLDAPLPVAAAAELDELFADCQRIIANSRQHGHPRFFGYVASPATPIGAFADLIASALNQNVPAWRSAPAATHVERTTVRWLAELIGYADGAGGLLTSGGSMANLDALYIAHRTKARGATNANPQADAAPVNVSQQGLWQAGAPMTVYLSDQAHHSIAKAADILGLGREHVRVVASDDRFRMDVRDLRAQVLADVQAGLRPFCVAATAGTVNTGAVDPLADIAAVAAEHDLWFHVDGAYGAPAALDATKRPLFAGLERADSVALDPHKWLYTPVDCGCLLLREPQRARAAWTAEVAGADYIKIFEQAADETFAFFDYGIELSRRFRALKLWLLLRYYGVARLAAAIADDSALAAYMAEQITRAADFELLAPVELSICCFRYVPEELRRARDAADGERRAQIEAELNRLNEQIVYAVQRGGRAYISNAVLRGHFALRACIVNFRTTRRDIDLTLDIIRDAAR